MVYYIYSEIKRTLRERFALIFLLGIVGASILANLSIIVFRDMIYGTNDGTYAYNIIMFAGGFFWLPYYLMIFISDMVFGKTYPDPYLRNRANLKLRRYQMFLGKLAAEFIMLILYAFAAFLIFLGVSFIFQMGAGPMEMSIVKDFAENLLLAVPLFMAGVALGNMFLFMFYDKKKAYVCYFGFVVVLERLIMILGAEPVSIGFFKWMKDNLIITPRFTELQFYATRNVPKTLILALAYIVIAAFIGCLCFLRKDTAKRISSRKG